VLIIWHRFVNIFLRFSHSVYASIIFSNTWYIFWVQVSCFTYTACKSDALYNVTMFSVTGCTMFLHITWRMQQFSKKNSLNKICVFFIFLQIGLDTPVVQRITHQYFIMNVHMCLFKVPIILVPFQQNMNFAHSFLKDLEYKIFWRFFYSETSCSMRVGERTDERTDLRTAIKNR